MITLSALPSELIDLVVSQIDAEREGDDYDAREFFLFWFNVVKRKNRLTGDRYRQYRNVKAHSPPSRSSRNDSRLTQENISTIALF